MSAAARSVVVFGWYLLGLGAVLVVAPNPLLAAFGVPATEEVWIRVLGVVVLVLGTLDVRVGREDFLPYLRARVPTRASVIVLFAAFVAAGLVKPVLVLFGLVDLAGAIWTAAALRRHPARAGGRPR